MEGFENVEGKVWEKNHQLKDQYEHITTQSKIMKNEIINLITSLGGNPSDSVSLSGSLHRAWIDIKNSVIVSHLEESTLQNVIFGEKAAIQSYQEALDSGDLDPESSEVISEQLKKIKDSSHQFQGIYDNINS